LWRKSHDCCARPDQAEIFSAAFVPDLITRAERLRNTLVGGRVAACLHAMRVRRNEPIFDQAISAHKREKTATVLAKTPAKHIRVMTMTELPTAAALTSSKSCEFFFIFHELFKGLPPKKHLPLSFSYSLWVIFPSTKNLPDLLIARSIPTCDHRSPGQ
jgi:hypothetical protein